MTVTTYIEIEGVNQLDELWERGEAVHEAWPWLGTQYSMVRIVGEAWINVKMAGPGDPDQLVQMLFQVIENRNDSRMHFLQSIVPREIVDEFREGFTRHRRSDNNSVAFFS